MERRAKTYRQHLSAAPIRAEIALASDAVASDALASDALASERRSVIQPMA